MSIHRSIASIRALLLFDAATCLLMGLVLLLARAPLAALTQIPAPLLVWAGGALLPVALFMAAAGLAKPVRHWTALLVVAGNLLWVFASLALVVAIDGLTVLGIGFVLSQAVAVAALTWLEYQALPGQTPSAKRRAADLGRG